MNKWPTEIRLRPDGRLLQVTFEDQSRIELSATLLRVESPSAEVQGHHPSQKITVTGKDNVLITKLEPVGNYAIKIGFDDGHQTGIYSWNYLQELAQKQQS
jgi:DUF971 family protein